MLLAVTERAAGITLDRDVFVATVGGARLSDPATDLAAVPGGLRRRRRRHRCPATSPCIGEVALSGDIRPVGHVAQRVAEAARLGYGRILRPAAAPPSAAHVGSARASSLHELAHLDTALESLASRAPAAGPQPLSGRSRTSATNETYP